MNPSPETSPIDPTNDPQEGAGTKALEQPPRAEGPGEADAGRSRAQPPDHHAHNPGASARVNGLWTRPTNQRTIALDFDGVLHEYTHWTGSTPQGQPIPGVPHALSELRRHGYRIIIHSTRKAEFIWPWLTRHGLNHLVHDVTAVKPLAIAYFDDRAEPVERNAAGGLLRSFHAFLKREGSGSR